MPRMPFEEYKAAVALLNKWAHAYYVLDAPIVPDSDYDALYREVSDYEAQNPERAIAASPTKRVGGAVIDGFAKSPHIERMWSLEDLFNAGELREWVARARKLAGRDEIEFVCEPKFDGASLSLVYENGLLIRAVTRGDGVIGEDVENNARAINSVPRKIAHRGLIEIRGEIVIYKGKFAGINDERIANGETPFANPRNAASGSLRQFDPKIAARRGLVFLPWGIGAGGGISAGAVGGLDQNGVDQSGFDQMRAIEDLGFKKVPFRKVCKSIEDIENAYNEILSVRDTFEMLLDGMVIKINDLSLRNALGMTIKFPRWAAAYKFPAIEKKTKLISVDWQVGRTGTLTPVGNLEPVEIEGAVIERATLHNAGEIARLDIRVGDTVSLIRSGDVIPKVTRVLKDFRPAGAMPIAAPQTCPSCGSKPLNDGALLKCQNLDCAARIVNSLIHFVSKRALNIDGLGKEIIAQLYEAQKIKHIEDIFALSEESFNGLEGFKERRISQLLGSIEASKKCELWRFINSLGIEHIGDGAAKKIAVSFGEDWDIKSEEDFQNIDGFGSEMSASIAEFIDVNCDRIKRLKSIIKPIAKIIDKIENSRFDAKTIVITGVFPITRDEIKSALESRGAKVSGSVSKKTDFLFAGNDAGSKLDKAIELGLEVLNWDDFRSEIGL